MKITATVTLIGCVALLLLAATDGMSGASPAPTESTAPVTGGIATLRLLDGETCSMSLLTGEPGGLAQDHELRNHDSHVVYGRYHDGEFKVGIQGGQIGRIVDLGSVDELRARLGFSDTVPGRQGFSSVHLRDGRFVIRGAAGSNETFQACPEADRVLEAGVATDHAPVALDHVYVLRLTDRNHEAFDLRAKLHVIGYEPGQSVTVRWERLSP